jgi:aminoglycoside phosphotransferase (APT) family kinase protein
MRTGDKGGGSSVKLEECLPAELRGPETTITRVAAGLSGAGVYRVEAAGRRCVLKVGSENKPLERFRLERSVLERAAEAGLAPRVVHVHEAQRAIVSEFVADRSFAALFVDPRTRESALLLLGQTLRRLHELPLPPGAATAEPRAFLQGLWTATAASGLAVPAFVSQVIERLVSEAPPERDRPLVLSHNDVNPTNLVYDGERLLLLDWDTAAPNDPYYDLAAISVFLRMDGTTCRRLLAAYDDAPVASAEQGLPARFTHNQRLAAALCGTTFLRMARHGGHPGAMGEETLEGTPDLGAVYQQVRSGALSLTGADGQWAVGLALLQASARL